MLKKVSAYFSNEVATERTIRELAGNIVMNLDKPKRTPKFIVIFSSDSEIDAEEDEDAYLSMPPSSRFSSYIS